MERLKHELDEIAKAEYKKQLVFWSFDQPNNKPEDDPETYGHLVLSHAWMEFHLRTGLGSWLTSDGKFDEEREKIAFTHFCKVNEVPDNLIEVGWKQYLED